jgi:hypothetical protein
MPERTRRFARSTDRGSSVLASSVSSFAFPQRLLDLEAVGDVAEDPDRVPAAADPHGRSREQRLALGLLACIAEHPLGRIVPHRHAGVGVDHWRTFRKLVNPVGEFQTQLVQNSGFWAYTDGTNIAIVRDTP